jgi:hypothetical protein
MAEQEVTLRTKYRYKPENGDKYLTLYFESGSNDVIIDTDIAGVSSEGKTNLTDVLVAINNMIQQRALRTIYDTSKSLKRKNLVLAQGQFGVESDTMRVKIGDGIHGWLHLPYVIGQPDSLDITDIVVDETSEITGKIGDQDVTLNLDNLQASTEIPEGARAFVQIIRVDEDPS